MKKRILAILLTLSMILSMMPTVFAGETEEDSQETAAYTHNISTGSITFTESNGVKSYKVGTTTKEYTGDFEITGTVSGSSTYITVSSGEHDITFTDVSITSSSTPITMASGATLNLTLTGTNTVTSSSSTSTASAIKVLSGATLNILGEGKLTASGPCAIGYNGTAGNISITDATVVATSSCNYTTGVVLGGQTSVGNITITDATVTVYSTTYFTYAVAIGSAGTAGTITIKGDSKVIATAGGEMCAIGAKTFDNIIITDDAVVNAQGFGKGAVIGVPNASTGTGTITVSGNAKVTTGQTLYTHGYNGAAYGCSVTESNDLTVPEGLNIVFTDNAVITMYDSPLAFRADSITIDDTVTLSGVALHEMEDLYGYYDNTSDPIYSTLTNSDDDARQIVKIDDSSADGTGFTGVLTLSNDTNSYLVDCDATSGNLGFSSTYTPYYHLTFVVVPGEYKLYNADGQVAQVDGEDIIFDASEEYCREDIIGYVFVDDVIDVSTDNIDFGSTDDPYATMAKGDEYFPEPTVEVEVNEETVSLTGDFTYSYNRDDYVTYDAVIDAIQEADLSDSTTIAITYSLAVSGDYTGTVTGTITMAYTADTVQYSANGNTITATLSGETIGALYIMAPEDLTYTGSVIKAYIEKINSDFLGELDATITYTQNGEICDTPTDVGTYTATITVTVGEEELTASITFAISKAAVTFSIADNSFEFGATPTVAVSSDDDLFVSDYTVTYLDSTGAEVTLSDETPVGVYTVQITVINSNYYLSGSVDSVVVYEGVKPTSDLFYVLNDDTGATDATDVVVGTITILPTPTKDNYTFAGWSYDGKLYAAGAEFVQPEADVTMTAIWVENTFIVDGTIKDENDSAINGVTVTLNQLDGTLVATATIDDENFSISDVAMGEYNIVASKVIDGITTTITTYVYITGNTTVDKILMDFSLTTSIQVEAGLNTTTASDLANAVSNQTYESGDEVEVKLVVTAANDDTAVEQITAASEDVGYVTDITVQEIVNTYTISTLSETDDLIAVTIDLPADMQGMAYYTVLRYHDGSVDTLKTSKNSDGEYIELVYTTIDEVEVVTGITIHARYFSTYAVTSSETVPSTSSSTNVGTIIYPDGEETEDDEEVETEVDTDDASFKDVDSDDYFYDAVEWAVENGVTTGTTGSTFSPDEPGTRAHVLTFLYRAFGEPETDGENVFDDVVDGSYYSEAVNWGIEMGITNGMGDGLFGTGETATRGQIVTFLYRLAGEPDMAGDCNFTDVDSEAYYYSAVLWAVENGITDGMGDGTFAPDDNCTRGQIVTFLYRYFN